MKQTIKNSLIFLLICIINLLALQNIALSEEKYEFERMWPVQQPWYFYGPYGIAIDAGGNLYVANYDTNNIQKYGPSGKFITNWGFQGNDNGDFEGPCGIAADKSGNIYVADSGNNRIQKFSSDGEFVTKWSGDFYNPRGIATDENDNVYI